MVGVGHVQIMMQGSDMLFLKISTQNNEYTA